MIWASPSRRALGVALLLLGEGLLLALRFDTESLLALRDHWWGRPLGYVSEVPRFVIAVATAALLLGGRKLSVLLHGATAGMSPQRRRWSYLLLHAVAVGAFAWLSEHVLEGPAEAVSRWVLPWFAAGLLAVILLLPLVARPSALWVFARGAAPVFLLSMAVGLAAWAAGHFSEGLARPLQGWTSLAVFRFVAAFRGDAFFEADEFVVGTPRFEVEIAPACSGYEGMGLIVVFLAVFLWTYRAALRFPTVLALVPLGAAVAWLANVGRLGLLVLVGELSPDMAYGGFHSYAGAVLFSGIALASAYLAQRLPVFAVAAPSQSAANVQGSATADAFLAPFVVFLAANLLTGLFAVDEVDLFYGLRVIAAGATLWLFRGRYTGGLRGVGWTAPAIGLAVAAAWLLVTPANPERTAALAEAAGQTPAPLVAGWLLLRVLGSVVVAPLVEELAFRGYLLRRLAARDFAAVDYRSVWLWPVAISSVVFGLLHTQIIAGTIAGAAYALAARRSGRLLDAVIAHAVSNAALIIYAVITRHWSVWL